MKRFLFLFISLILLLSIALTGCSNSLYNNNVKEGFIKQTNISGIEFCTKKLDNEILSEMDYLSLLLSEEPDEKLEKKYFEIKDDKTYSIFNLSKEILYVFPLNTEKNISEFNSPKDVSDNVNIGDDVKLEFNDYFKKNTSKNKAKIITSVKLILEGKEKLSKTFEFDGYLSVLQNEQKNTYVLLTVTNSKEELNNCLYVAKSIDFTSDSVFTNTNDDVPQETLTTGEEAITTFDGKLTDFSLIIDNKEIKLPIKTSDFLTLLDISLPKENLDDKLKKNECTFFSVKNGSKNLYIHITNLTNEDDASINDCSVYTVSADKFDIYGYGDNLNPNISIILPSSIVIAKSTYEDVIKAYGEPSETKNNDDSDFIYLTWNLGEHKNDHYTHMKITIEKKSNLVYDFEYGHLPL